MAQVNPWKPKKVGLFHIQNLQETTTPLGSPDFTYPLWSVGSGISFISCKVLCTTGMKPRPQPSAT